MQCFHQSSPRVSITQNDFFIKIKSIHLTLFEYDTLNTCTKESRFNFFPFCKKITTVFKIWTSWIDTCYTGTCFQFFGCYGWNIKKYSILFAVTLGRVIVSARGCGCLGGVCPEGSVQGGSAPGVSAWGVVCHTPLWTESETPVKT